MRCHNYNHHKEVIRVFKRKRKGVALITVILISALLFVSIIGITLKVIPENKIIVARSSSQRALTAAETGLSQVLFNLRNADFISGTTAPSIDLQYLTIGNVESIASMSKDDVLTVIKDPPPPYGTSMPYVTYQLKIIKTSDYTWTPDDEPSDEEHTVDLEIHSMGIVYRDSTKKEIAARKVISTTCRVVFNKTATSHMLSLGILAGGDINFSGNSQVVGGDIFANGGITSNGGGHDYRVDGGKAYAAVGPIPGGIASGGEYSPVDTIDIAKQFVPYTKSLAWEFKTGAYPYNGTESGYPNTSDPIVQAVIRTYLLGVTEDAGDTLEDIHAFYNDLMAGTGAFLTLTPTQLTDLQTNAKKIAYYYNGDFKITGSTIKDFGDEDKGYLDFGGIIIINGDLSIDSGVKTIIGDITKLNLAFIVRGEVTIKATGGATFNGLLYAENGIKMTSGTMDINGAIVTEGNIEVKGDSKITYHDVGLNTITVKKLNSNEVSDANIGLSSWKEISFDEF